MLLSALLTRSVHDAMLFALCFCYAVFTVFVCNFTRPFLFSLGCFSVWHGVDNIDGGSNPVAGNQNPFFSRRLRALMDFRCGMRHA